MRIHCRIAVASLATFAALALAACSDSPDIVTPSTRQGLRPGAIPSHSVEASSPGISLLSFEVHSASLPSTFLYDIPLTNGATSASLSIPAGEGYDVVVRGYDRYGVQTHQGTLSLGSVVVGSNGSYGVALEPVQDGLAYAKVSVGLVGESRIAPGGRIIIKMPTSVNQGASVNLAAYVYDAEGRAVELRPGDLHWAIDDPQGGTIHPDPSNPRIATYVANAPSSYNLVLQYKNLVGKGSILANLDPVTKLAAGFDFTCALRKSGAVYCWGYNYTTESLGTASAPTPCDGVTCAQVPIRVAAPRVFTDIAAGWMHACAIESGTGDTYCWGDNWSGQLGIGTTQTAELPTRIANGMKFQQLTAGDQHTCGISSGIAYCWGGDTYGQLGNGTDGLYGQTPPDQPMPVAIANYSGWTQLAAGDEYTCGIINNGMKCWGSGKPEVIGAGGTGNSDWPLSVTATYAPELPVSLGGGSTAETMCAIMQTSGAWCWGYNIGAYSVPGVGGESNVPEQFTGSQALTQVATGAYQSCGLDSNGKAYCWGHDEYGATGQPPANTYTIYPTAVSFPWAFSTIVSGSRHVCAVRALFGSVYCWGLNTRAQLGDNSIDNGTNVPQRVWGT